MVLHRPFEPARVIGNLKYGASGAGGRPPPQKWKEPPNFGRPPARSLAATWQLAVTSAHASALDEQPLRLPFHGAEPDVLLRTFFDKDSAIFVGAKRREALGNLTSASSTASTLTST